MFHRTKTLSLLAACLALVLTSAAALAEEPTFLERLSAETTELAERARRATVRVSAADVSCEAVLVGSPPRLVTAFVPIGTHPEIRFVLPDGQSGKARRIAGERELDVAVYELPEGVTAASAALVPASRWALPPGRIAVLGGEQPRLVLTRDTRGARDGLRIGAEDDSGVLLAADGTLLGLRPRVTGASGYYFVTGSHASTYTTTVQRDVTFPLQGWVVDAAEPAVVRLAAPGENGDEGVDVDAPTDEEGAPDHRVELVVTPTVTNLCYVRSSRPAVSVLTPKTFHPGALIHRVLEDLTNHGRVRHAYLGVVPAAPEKGSGAMLVTVLSASPAAKAGLRGGEIVTSVDGEPVANVAAFTRQIVLREPGEAITLLVRGRRQPVHVVLGAQEEARRQLPTPEGLGFEVVPLSPELRRWLGASDAEQGVAVRAVKENSPAAKAGVRRGDVIVRGGDQPTRDIEELLAALAGAERQLVLTVRRGGRESRLLLALRLPAPEAGAGSR